MLHKRLSFFPLILAFLTLGLILLMFYSFSFADRGASAPIVEEVVTPVNSDEYQQSVSGIVTGFQADFADAEDNLKQIFVTEKTLAKILALKVPTEFQSAHLGLAMSLNNIVSGLRGEERDATEGLAALELVLAEHSWIIE